MKNHDLNEKLKRLEPKSQKCAYCANGLVTNMDITPYYSIHNEVEKP